MTEEAPKTLTLKVKTLKSEVHTVQIESDATVKELKFKLQEITTVGVCLQRLIFKGKVLTDTQPLSAYGLTDDCCLHLVERPPSYKPSSLASASSSTTSSATSSSSNAASTSLQAPPPPRTQNPPSFPMNVVMGTITFPNGPQLPAASAPSPQGDAARQERRRAGLLQLQTQRLQALTRQLENLQTSSCPSTDFETTDEHPVKELGTVLGSLSQCLQKLEPGISTLSYSLLHKPETGTQEERQVQEYARQLAPLCRDVGKNVLQVSQSLSRVGSAQDLSSVQPAQPATVTARIGGNISLRGAVPVPVNVMRGRSTSGSTGGSTQPSSHPPESDDAVLNSALQQVLGSAASSNGPASLMMQVLSNVTGALHAGSNPTLAQMISRTTGRPVNFAREGIWGDLLDVILNTMLVTDANAFSAGSWECTQKLQQPMRALMCKYVGEYGSIRDEYIHDFANCLGNTVEQVSTESSLPAHIKAMVKPGKEAMAVFVPLVRTHLRHFVLTVYSTPLPTEEEAFPFAKALKVWYETFVEELVSSLSAVLVGGTSQVPDLIRTLVSQRLHSIPPQFSAVAADMVAASVMKTYASNSNSNSSHSAPHPTMPPPTAVANTPPPPGPAPVTRVVQTPPPSPISSQQQSSCSPEPPVSEIISGWRAIIERDEQRQGSASPQALSEVYLSGSRQKRRRTEPPV